ncbi:MAG TPA: hypothetical protein PKE20_09795 [Promineifilum sp.]|nr:hypothetical protein [Promineifilum sp.]
MSFRQYLFEYKNRLALFMPPRPARPKKPRSTRVMPFWSTPIGIIQAWTKSEVRAQVQARLGKKLPSGSGERIQRKFVEATRGQAVGYNDAYREGYAAKYDRWFDRSNPYAEGTIERDGFDDGYAEAVAMAC